MWIIPVIGFTIALVALAIILINRPKAKKN